MELDLPEIVVLGIIGYFVYKGVKKYVERKYNEKQLQGDENGNTKS